MHVIYFNYNKEKGNKKIYYSRKVPLYITMSSRSESPGFDDLGELEDNDLEEEEEESDLLETASLPSSSEER